MAKQSRKPTSHAAKLRKANSTNNSNTRMNRTSALYRYSAPVLLRLHGWPRWLFPVLTAGLLVGGLLVPNTVLATVLLALLSLILLWLIAMSWPVLKPLPRLMRVLVLGALVLVTVQRAGGAM